MGISRKLCLSSSVYCSTNNRSKSELGTQVYK